MNYYISSIQLKANLTDQHRPIVQQKLFFSIAISVFEFCRRDYVRAYCFTNPMTQFLPSITS